MKFRADFNLERKKPTRQERMVAMKKFYTIESLTNDILKKQSQLESLLDNCKHSLFYEEKEMGVRRKDHFFYEAEEEYSVTIRRCSTCGKSI